MPIFRTVAPFVAGVGKMHLGKYTLYNVIGGASWVILFLFLGYFFGGIPVIKRNFTIVVILIILVSVIPPIIAAVRSRTSSKTTIV